MEQKESSSEAKKLHIAMFPWLAFGHMIPYLELAKLISQKGHSVSFISTPKNIHRLPKLPPNQITFVPLRLPRVRHLPPDAEATSDLSERQAVLLKKAHDGLRDQVRDFLGSAKPDWILSDFTAYWLPDAARELGVNSAFFSIFIGAAVGFMGGPAYPDGRTTLEDFTSLPKWVPFESHVAFRCFEVKVMLDEFVVSVGGEEEEEEEEISVLYRGFQVLRGSDVIAIRSSWEFEPEWLRLIEDLHRKPVVPVGQLPPTPYLGDDDDGEEADTWRYMKRWLDERDKSSVVYVAFGSEAKPSQAELNEIALGLEMSGLPFLWVLRTRRGEFDPDPVRLPDGFETRVKDRGVVCMEWAPQKKILAHDSVGGMVTHAGWSSVVEALGNSRPLIMLTFSNDQGLNARLLEEKRVGYSVPRDENDGSFRREDVAESLDLVLVKEQGQVYRDNAKELSSIFGNRDIQGRYVDQFLALLINYKSTL